MGDRRGDTDETIRDLARANQELAAQLATAERQNPSATPVSQTATTSVGPSPVPHSGRRVARALTWPVRRLFDPRFGGLARQIDAKQIDLFDRLDHLRDEALAINHERAQAQGDLGDLAKYQAEQLAIAVGLLEAQFEASAESTAILGRTLVDVRGDTQDATSMLQSVEAALVDLQTRVKESIEPDIVGNGDVSTLGADVARLLNFASSHVGFAAQRHLWINQPVGLEYTAGNVNVSSVNERIVEVPYAMRALSEITPPAAIIDVGAAESTLSLSLASLGYQVTALDPNGYPFDHPNIEVLETPVAALPAERSFAAAVCVSTIEHIGLGAYRQAPSVKEDDLAAIRRLHDALTPAGLLILTVPFGKSRTDERERTYDRSSLNRLLEGWKVVDLTIVTRESRTIWAPAAENVLRRDSVALVTARRR